MGHRTVAMLVGLALALGMGALLLVWLNTDQGAGITGLLFILGTAAGIVVVLAAALASKSSD